MKYRRAFFGAQRSVRSGLVGAVAVAVFVASVHPAGAEVLGGAGVTVAASPPHPAPEQGRATELDGLQFGDAAAGIGIVDPPEADSFGEAQLRYPIDIPPGRLGWQPQLGLAYGSGGDNGWMGVGWDLSLDAIRVPGLGSDVSADAIEVDNRWGVPRYDGSVESESYLFGGEQLSPNAHRADQPSRNTGDDDRKVFTKRVEGDYLLIIRHGTTPRDYWWEVHDKLGNKYFYGGAVDERFNRADDGVENVGPEDGHQVAEAILTDDQGDVYWWGLREKWDISTNVVTYFYDKTKNDSGVGDGTSGPKGTELYLDHINYSGSKLRKNSTYGIDDTPLPRWGRYDVEFVRDTELGEPRRPDVSIDASNGALEVTAELLRQVKVWYCPDTRGVPGSTAVNYPAYNDCAANRQLVRRYDLNYEIGPFAKNLLTSIGQADLNGNVFATHTLDYFDDVRDGQTYKGFDESGDDGYRTWATHLDNTTETILGVEFSSALGGATSTSGDGRLYLGFNPISPDKNISIGGGLQLAGSDGKSTLEFIDINGDGLPEQVYKTGGGLFYRLNQSGPTGEPRFSDEVKQVGGLGNLPENSSFSVGVGFEAYLVANIMYNHTWTFSEEASYFADVNTDGLPDFVDHGTVLFNHRAPNGDISFSDTSNGTDVVIVPRPFLPGETVLPSFADIEAQQRSQFPLQDTVRRWLAPFSGTINIKAPVYVKPASPDGVKVAVQLNGGEPLWQATIPGGDNVLRYPGGVDGLNVPVSRGDRLYFRVQPVDNGAGDLVSWDPAISYVGKAPAVDANGRDAYNFAAASEFTLAGRPGIYTAMPLNGRVEVAGKVRKLRPTTDDVRVVVELNGTPVLTLPPIPASVVGDVDVHGQFDVQGPRANGDTDKVTLRLAVDSHIDVTAVAWTGDAGTGGPPMFYVNATDAQGQPVNTHDANGKPLIQLHPLYDIDFYEASNLTGAQQAVRPFADNGNPNHAETTRVHVEAHISMPHDTPRDILPATVAFTMKSSGGLVRKGFTTVPRPITPITDPATIFAPEVDFGDVEVVEGQFYWFDVTSSDPRVGPLLRVDAEAGSDVDAAVRWPMTPVNDDQATVFPQPYRGWAYAGYNGDGARADQRLYEDDFRFREDDYPDEEADKPTGFAPGIDPLPGTTTDGSFKTPIKAKSYAYAPDPDTNHWRGPKDANPSAKVVGATYGAAGEASASRLGPDSVGAPGAAELMPAGASAPIRLGRANEHQVSAGILGAGASSTTGTSRGVLDFMDLNGDGYPDVVGDGGDVMYTNQVGGRGPVEGVPGLGGDVRSDHEFGWSAGGGGSPVSIKKSASGDGNTQKQAGTGTKIGSHRKSSGTKSGGQKSSISKAQKNLKAVTSAPSRAINSVKSQASKAAKSAATKAGNAAKSAVKSVAKAVATKGASLKSGAKTGSGKGKTSKSSTKNAKSNSKSTKSSKNNKSDKNKGSSARKAISKAAPSLDVAGSYNETFTNTEHDLDIFTADPEEEDLADMNGDGLPDRVKAAGGTLRVWWNLGYRFATEPVEWPSSSALEQGSSTGFGVSGGIGFNIGSYGFAGGVSLSQDEEATDVTWSDVNGDGLPDRLTAHDDGVTVSFNTGGGLFTPPAWDGGTNWGHFMADEVGQSDSRGLGGGADLTIGIGPLCPPWFLKLCFIIINPGAHVETSVTAARIALADIDGDGYDDTLSSDDDGSINVRLNKTGRTNMLRAVHRPLGGSFNLEYERVGNTTDKPESEWLLSKVSVNDGHPGDGVDVQATTYRYEDGKFSFTEREAFGSHKVVESELDQNGNVYRSYERIYDTSNYYARGMLLEETMYEAGKAKVSTVNTYEIVDSKTGIVLTPEQLKSTTASAYPHIAKVEERWHDAGGNVAKRAETTYQYDFRGNLIRMADLGEPDLPADDAIAELAYTVCGGIRDDDPTGDYPWTQTAYSLHVKSGNGTWLQRREANMECNTASVSEVRDYLNPTGEDADAVAVTDVVYVDVGGQLKEVTGPGKRPAEGGPDSRYGVFYAYDEVGAAPIKTSDSFGLTATAAFDYRLGVMLSSTDPNNARTSYTYDDRGRVKTVRGPLQQGAGQPATIAFDYHTEANPPYVVAAHVDAARPGTTIDTVSFIDGLEREIQTKQDASIFTAAGTPSAEVMVISGPVVYDAFGRPVEEFFPTTEPVGSPGAFRTARDSHSTTMKYDVLDRVTELVEPTNRKTTVAYGFANAGGQFPTMFSTLETDPENSRTRMYSDVRDNVVGAVRLRGNAEPLVRYDYDALARLTKVTDLGGKVTGIGYDLMGRQTFVDNPDTGKIEMRYDLADNQVAEITPNLRAAGGQTVYDYDRNRLTAVRYPLNPANNVTYTYGAPGPEGQPASGNAAGRVTRVDDGARTQTRSYDLLGEVVSETTLMKVQNLSPSTAAAHTYTTSFVYDTWSRPLTMTYPDGEVLTYSYDSGGNASALAGVKGPNAYRYVDRLEYDKFGNQQFLTYSNGVANERSYEHDTTWLSTQVLTRGTAKLQDLKYSYDKVGDVLERKDSRPVPPASEMGGPSTQTFTYDDLHRLTSATGTYKYQATKQRDYTSSLTYDAAGRVTNKKQSDKISGKEQKDTTYDLGYQYNGAQPHAPTRAGAQTNTWDADGNFTSWTDDKGGGKRTVAWDEEDRVKSIADQGSTTTYLYTDEDLLAIERGPQSEVEFVNEFYTAMSGGVTWKNFVLDDAVLATKRAYFDGKPEDLRYFLTSDLTDSVNIVTDATGKIFEHLEYFPSGEIWVREHSETFREPYLFEGSYHEEVRNLSRMGVRWYEPQEGFMYSAEPIIGAAPDSLVEDSRLLGAFTYAFDNPTTYIDETGYWAQAVNPGAKAASPGPLHSQVRAKVKAFVQDPDVGENISGLMEAPSLIEIDISGDGMFGLGLSVIGFDVKHIKHVRKLVRR